ncbi:MAG: hypothetical protein WC291_06865, partial [Thermodesulfovibrionales bacterium]
ILPSSAVMVFLVEFHYDSLEGGMLCFIPPSAPFHSHKFYGRTHFLISVITCSNAFSRKIPIRNRY